MDRRPLPAVLALMNFSLAGGGIGFVGGWVLSGALMIAFTIVATVVVRIVRGRDDRPAGRSDGRTPEDDYIV